MAFPNRGSATERPKILVNLNALKFPKIAATGILLENLKVNICNRLIEGQTNGHEIPTRLALKKTKIVIRWSAWQTQKQEGEGEKSATCYKII